MCPEARAGDEKDVLAINEIVSKYSVIVMDVDGTMVGPDFTVSARLRRAVRSARDTGAIVSIATGRMMRSA